MLEINNKKLYLIKFDMSLDLDMVYHCVEGIANRLLEVDPEAEWIAIPKEMTIEHFTINDLIEIRNALDNYIINHMEGIQEKE